MIGHDVPAASYSPIIMMGVVLEKYPRRYWALSSQWGPVSTRGYIAGTAKAVTSRLLKRKEKKPLASELCTRRITGDDSEEKGMYK